MARKGKRKIQPMQDVPLHERLNPFYQGKTQRANEMSRVENARRQQEMDLAQERNAMMRGVGLPKSVRNNEFAKAVGDRVVDARHLPYGQLTAVTAGALATGGLLNAYSQQQQEGLPTGPIATLGRGASNLVNGMTGMGGVGSDPLAQARANVQEAQRQLGSDAVLEAVVVDQLNPAQQAASFEGQVAEMVNIRAAELMNTPIQMSDGTLKPMDYDTAIRLSQEEVSMQLRAEGIL